MLTEEQIQRLITLAQAYAQKVNLDANAYISGLLNTDTIGQADPKVIVDNLIRYHEEWLRKAS